MCVSRGVADAPVADGFLAVCVGGEVNAVKTDFVLIQLPTPIISIAPVLPAHTGSPTYNLVRVLSVLVVALMFGSIYYNAGGCFGSIV